MTKPRLVKVRALFYVLQQVTKRGCIRILIHPPLHCFFEPLHHLFEMSAVESADRTYKVGRKVAFRFEHIAAYVTFESSLLRPGYLLGFRFNAIGGSVFRSFPFYHVMIIRICHRLAFPCMRRFQFAYDNHMGSAVDEICCGQYKAPAELPLYGRSSINVCLLYTSPSPRDRQKSRMPSSA